MDATRIMNHTKKTYLLLTFIIGIPFLFIPISSIAAVDPSLGINLPSAAVTQAQNLLIENILYKKKYRDAISFINEELKKYPNNPSLLYQKASVYIDMEDYENAEDTLNKIDKNLADNAKTDKLRNIIEKMRKNEVKNELGFNWDESYVSDVAGYWAFSSLHYYRFTHSGTYGGRINYAQRFGTTGEQYQVEAYPKFEEPYPIEYIQLKFAYANFTQILWPNYQYLVEPYFRLPKNFEISVGQSGLHSVGTNIYTFTGSLANYLGSNYIWFRPYHYTPKTTNFFEAGIRHYFDDNTYISMTIGAGKAPDILDLAPLNQIIILNQKLITIKGQYAVNKTVFLQAGAGYLKQVFPSNKLREITDGNIGIVWQF